MVVAIRGGVAWKRFDNDDSEPQSVLLQDLLGFLERSESAKNESCWVHSIGVPGDYYMYYELR